MNVARSTVKLFFVMVINALGGFIVYLYLARELGSSELGILFLFQALTGILRLPSDMGIRVSIEKRISEGKDRSQYLSSGLIYQLSMLLAVIILSLPTREYIDEYIGINIYWALILYLFVRQLSVFFDSVVKGELRVGKSANVRLIRRFIWIALSISVVFFGKGIFSLIYVMIISEGIGIVAYIYYIQTSLASPTFSHFLSLFDFAKYSIIPSISGYSFSWIDILLIGYFLTSSSVSSYELSWQIAGLIALLGNAVMFGIFPQISNWFEQNMLKEVQNLMYNSINVVIFISIPAFFGSLYLSEEILEHVYGPEYTIASTALIILILGMMFQSIRNVQSKVLQGMKMEKLVNKASIVDISVNILFNIVLIPIYGLTGAAFATGISLFIGSIIRGRYIAKRIQYSFPMNEIVWTLAASSIMVSLLYFIDIFINYSGLFRLAFLISLGVIFYALILLLNSSIRHQFFYMVESILK